MSRLPPQFFDRSIPWGHAGLKNKHACFVRFSNESIAYWRAGSGVLATTNMEWTPMPFQPAGKGVRIDYPISYGTASLLAAR